MKNKSLAAVALILAGLLGACNAKSGQGAKLAAGHAECTVCACNADLACLDVKIDEHTPRAEYNGKTYYFCSDSCRNDFLKDPAKYANFKAP